MRRGVAADTTPSEKCLGESVKSEPRKCYPVEKAYKQAGGNVDKGECDEDKFASTGICLRGQNT